METQTEINTQENGHIQEEVAQVEQAHAQAEVEVDPASEAYLCLEESQWILRSARQLLDGERAVGRQASPEVRAAFFAQLKAGEKFLARAKTLMAEVRNEFKPARGSAASDDSSD